MAFRGLRVLGVSAAPIRRLLKGPEKRDLLRGSLQVIWGLGGYRGIREYIP